MKLVVGFLTYNEFSSKYLTDFLPSLKKALEFLAPADYQVLVFDNSQPENNLNRLAIEFFNHQNDNPVQYFSSGENLGFSRAYNILINQAVKLKATYFLIINPDTLLEPGAINKLMMALEKDGSLGSVAPKILQWDFANQRKANIIDSLGLALKPGLKFIDLEQGSIDSGQIKPLEILGPSGAAGLFRLSALEKIKENNQYFDERFFMYKEDCDLAYRLYLDGFKSKLIIDSIIYHDRSVSSSGSHWRQQITDRAQKSHQVRAWSFRNQHFIFVKHWKKQNLVNQILIVFRMISFFIFSLILEQFLLKEYYKVLTFHKPLTNVK